MGKQLPGMSSPPASNTGGFGQNLGQMSPMQPPMGGFGQTLQNLQTEQFNRQQQQGGQQMPLGQPQQQMANPPAWLQDFTRQQQGGQQMPLGQPQQQMGAIGQQLQQQLQQAGGQQLGGQQQLANQQTLQSDALKAQQSGRMPAWAMQMMQKSTPPSRPNTQQVRPEDPRMQAMRNIQQLGTRFGRFG